MVLRQVPTNGPITLAGADLARLHFAHSPLREVVASLRALRTYRRNDVYQPWLSAVQRRLDGLDLDLLAALAPAGPRAHGFLFPVIDGAEADIKAELDALAATAPETVRDDLASVAQERPITPALRPLYDDPQRHLSAVADALTRYWRAAVEPFWPRLRQIVLADQHCQTKQFAAGGVARLLQELHPSVSYRDGCIHVDRSRRPAHRCDLGDRPIALVPCVFAWPTIVVGCCGTAQPSLTYPPRGAGSLIESRPDAEPECLLTLVGRSKVQLLAALEYPKTTTQLSRELNISPPAVSQQLKVLRSIDLVDSRRGGRAVWYQRTATAAALLASVRPEQAVT
jgi:DNA-binding transcriptional ArsR family regulator